MLVELEIYAETGTEGAYWACYDPTKEGFEGLHILKEGDLLIIPNVWEGKIKKDSTTNLKWYNWAKPYADKKDYKGMAFSYSSVWPEEWTDDDFEEYCKSVFRQQSWRGMRCHWFQEGIDPELWGLWFYSGLKAELYVE